MALPIPNPLAPLGWLTSSLLTSEQWVPFLQQIISISAPQLQSAITGTIRQIGEIISLTALVPAPDVPLYLTKIGSIPAAGSYQLVPSSTFSIHWEINVLDAGKDSRSARSASSPTDPFGDYYIVQGDLSSADLQVILWPTPSFGPKDNRTFKFKFKVTLSMPSDANNAAGQRFTVAAYSPEVECLIDSWGSYFTVASDKDDVKTLDLSNTVPTASADPFNLRNMFNLKIDTTNPLPGKPVTLQALPVDKTVSACQRVESIIDSAPDLRIQAALDVGAPLASVINAVGSAVSAVSGLFGKGQPVLPNPVAKEALSVASVLAGKLTIPIALDFAGRSLSKTLKPTFENQLATSIASLPSPSDFQGLVPIGNLVMSISTTSSDLLVTAASASAEPSYFILQALDSVCGQALTLLPSFRAVSDRRAADSQGFDVKLVPDLTLPGFSGTKLKLNIPFGTVSISLPIVPLPQVAVFFHDDHFKTRDTQNSIFLAVDPITDQLLGTAADATTKKLPVLSSQIVGLVNELLAVLTTVEQAFPGGLPVSSPNFSLGSFQNLKDSCCFMRDTLNFASIGGYQEVTTFDIKPAGWVPDHLGVLVPFYHTVLTDKWKGDPDGITSGISIGFTENAYYKLWFHFQFPNNITQNAMIWPRLDSCFSFYWINGDDMGNGLSRYDTPGSPIDQPRPLSTDEPWNDNAAELEWIPYGHEFWIFI